MVRGDSFPPGLAWGAATASYQIEGAVRDACTAQERRIRDSGRYWASLAAARQEVVP